MKSDMRFACSQKGMPLLGWPVVLGVVVFFASVAFKIIPHYMDYYSLEKTIIPMETDETVEVRSVPGLCSYVGKGMQISGICNLDLREVLEAQLENSQFRACLEYEKRGPSISNIDLVAHFDKEFRVRMP